MLSGRVPILRHECQEAPWIIHQNAVQRIVLYAGFGQLFAPNRDCFGISTAAVSLQLIRIGQIRGKHEISRVSSLNESQDHGDLPHIAWSTLTIESDEGAALANFLLDFYIGIYQVAQVPDDDPIRFHAAAFQNIELLDGRFSGYAGVGENGEIRLLMRLRDGAEYFALILGDFIPAPDLAHHADRLRVGLADDLFRDLILTPGGDLGWIKRLGIKTTTGDDRHPGFDRQLL